jgi:hypothetical protein
MYQVFNAATHQLVGEHKTKKGATAQADEMVQAHREIDAKHEGAPVTFKVEKVEDPAPAEEAA